jgi:hypothetical protein
MEIDPLIFLAAHAPAEIPAWFQHAPPPNKPVQPPSLQSFDPGTKDRDDAEQAHEGFMPDETVRAWNQAWEEHRVVRDEWNQRDAMNRYFQWRIHFAMNLGRMLDRVSTPPPPAPGEMTPRTTSP